MNLDSSKQEHTKYPLHLVRLPFLLAIGIAAGIFMGVNLFGLSDHEKSTISSLNKFREVLGILDKEYVDTLDPAKITELAVTRLLERLDPHSHYVPLGELDLTKASLESDFEGIGIEFQIQDDTVQVISAIHGGPSEQVGILPGDRIVSTNDKPFTGSFLNTREVFNRLRGPKGSIIKLGIKRDGLASILSFEIKRATISSQSVEAAIMVKPGIGYLKLSRFSDNTFVECKQKLGYLKDKGAKAIILDLRDNPGGYMDRATRLADEFLPDNQLIVYTEGKSKKYQQEYYSTKSGLFLEEPLIVLVNEGSASASEIIAGAIQDNDRGLIVGRRTFGKGLVQAPISLKDGSELRLTISRYFTPSGRCIQKPYKQNFEEYDQEIAHRFQNGELFRPDSIHLNDFPKFKTKTGRVVVGDGGILPDYFVPLDTMANNAFLISLMQKNLFREFANTHCRQHPNWVEKWKQKRPEDFKLPLSMWVDFVGRVEKSGIVWGLKKQDLATEKHLIHLLKAYTARIIWGNDGFFTVLCEQDPMVKSAIEHIPQARKLYQKSRQNLSQ